MFTLFARSLAQHPRGTVHLRHGSSFESQCVKSGQAHPGLLRGVNVPIVTSTTYEFEDVAHGAELCAHPDIPYASPRGFVYSRHCNPTCEAVSRSIATLENASQGGARLFSSGMAAMTSAITATVKQVSRDFYMYVCIYMCMYVYVCICVYVCMDVCMCVYICMKG